MDREDLRLDPHNVQGWEPSWWLHEQGLTRSRWLALSPAERVAWMERYWSAHAAGWRPAVAAAKQQENTG